ncbi:MAG: nuclear transport factor 2 family protein [Actinomycetota bacterium]
MSADFTEITSRVYQYAYGIDLRDWDLYRSIFADEVTVDFSSYNRGGGPRTMSSDDWVANLVPLFTGLDASQHSMSNPLVDIDADEARCRMYMQAAHFLFDDPEPEFTIGGYYDDRLLRTGSGWRVTAVTLTVWWRRGNEAIMPVARERGVAALGE